MVKVNKAIDWEELLMEEDGMFFKADKYIPKKVPMRMRFRNESKPQMDWRDDRHPNMDTVIWKQIYGFIEKRVGKSYNKVYSEFLKRPEFKDRNISIYSTYFTPRDYFDQLVTGRNFYGRVQDSDFIIDDQGRIQYNPDVYVKPIKNKDIPIYYPQDQQYTTCTPKLDVIKKYADDFIKIFGSSAFGYIIKMDPNTQLKTQVMWDKVFIHRIDYSAVPEFKAKIPSLPESKNMYWTLGESSINEIFRFFFNEYRHYIERYIKYGTAEYYDYLAYQKREKQRVKESKANNSRYAEAIMIYRKRHPEITNPTYEQLMEEFNND